MQKKVIVSFIIIALLVGGVLLLKRDKASNALLGERGIIITKPSSGALITIGSKIQINIEPKGGISLNKVWAWIEKEPFNIKKDESTPFNIELNVSGDIVGGTSIIAEADDTSGERFKTSIPVMIQPPTPFQRLDISPERVLFFEVGERANIYLAGVLQDGERLTIDSSVALYESTNTKVATINSSGHVAGVGLGTSNLIIKYGSLEKTIPVRVGVFELKGDLNGDSFVDQNDVDIIQKGIGFEATGVDDPRDLDKDGVITIKDVTMIKTLCSRSKCVKLEDQ